MERPRAGRTHLGRGAITVLLLSVLLPGAGARLAHAGGCWANREALREKRKQEEEERQRREEEEEAAREAEEARKAAEATAQEVPTPGTPPVTTPDLSSSGSRPSPRSTAAGRRGGRGAGSSSLLGTWRGWWLANDRALLPERGSAAVLTSPIMATRDTPLPRFDACESDVLSTIRGVLDPEGGCPELMLRGALIAIGKSARTEAGPSLLVHWLDAKDVATEVREAAALGIGLLRRSAPALQLDVHVLDALRRHLLRTIADPDVADPVRATAALSVGLLGDQPFPAAAAGSPSPVTEHLWRVLVDRTTSRNLTVALLTALGMQPPATVGTAHREALRDVVAGRPAPGRTFDDVERSHALVALVRLEGVQAWGALRAVLSGRRVPDEVRRGALIALGRLAPVLDEGGRDEAAGAVRDAMRRAHDPLTRGLALVATGHLLRAQRTGDDALRGDVLSLSRTLLSQARTGPNVVRGFAAVALGLAWYGFEDGASLDGTWRSTHAETREVLGELLGTRRDDADASSAAAVALGLMRARDALPVLIGLVEDGDAPEMLRWDAAVALGQIGQSTPEVLRALQVAIHDRRLRVRTGAALGFSLLKGSGGGAALLRELEQADTSDEIARLTEPLGFLVGADEAAALVRYVGDESHGTYARASMLVALGNIADPEARPALCVLGAHANYAAGTPSLMDAILAR